MKILYLSLVLLTLAFGNLCSIAEDLPVKAKQSLEATTYQIRNLSHRDLLRPKDANGATGTPIVLYPSQPWKCMTWELQPAGDSAFHLKNLFTSKTFSAATNAGTALRFVSQVPLVKTGGEVPAWELLKLADGSYEITDTTSGQALTALKVPGEGEVKIIVAPWKNMDEQKWQLEKMDPKKLSM